MSVTLKKAILLSAPVLSALLFAASIQLPGVTAVLVFFHFFFLLAPLFERKPLHFSLFFLLAGAALLIIFNQSIVDSFSTIQNTENIFENINSLFFQYFILNDPATIIVTIVLCTTLIFFSQLKKKYLRQCANLLFEHRYVQINKAQDNLAVYFRRYSMAAIIAVPLWSISAYFLEFRPISSITVAAGFAAALPFWGMISIAVLLLIFTVKEFIFLQSGGLLILLSVNWFINHLLNIQKPLEFQRHLQIFALIATCYLLNIPHTAIFVIPVCITVHIILDAFFNPAI